MLPAVSSAPPSKLSKITRSVSAPRIPFDDRNRAKMTSTEPVLVKYNQLTAIFFKFQNWTAQANFSINRASLASPW